MIRLYPKVVVKAQSFKGVPKIVVPNQSMSLQEILKRFIKRESLPVARQGVYEERFGDLEKLDKADITEKMDRIEQLKSDIAAFNKREKERAEAALKAQSAASAPPSSPPIVPAQGVEPVKSPPL